MCLPAALVGAAGVVSSAIGVGVQAFGAKHEAQAHNKAMEYNAIVAERNEDISNMQAANAEERGAIEEKRHRIQLRQMIGSQRAGFAGSGVMVDTGSAMDVLLDTTEQGELDAMTIRNNASMEAWGHRTQAGNYAAQAALHRSSKRDPKAAFWGSLLTGATRVGDRYLTYRASQNAANAASRQPSQNQYALAVGRQASGIARPTVRDNLTGATRRMQYDPSSGTMY